MPNEQVQNISSMSVIISKLKALYFYPKFLKKTLKINYFKVYVLVYCLPFSNDIDKSRIYLFKDFKQDSIFCLIQTVLSQSQF